MNRFLTLLVLTTLILAGPSIVHAGDDVVAPAPDTKQVAMSTESDAGFYVAAYGGANFAQHYGSQKIVESDPGFPVDTIKGGGGDGMGAVGGVKAGYNFDSCPLAGDFRIQPAVELEGLYLGSYSKQTYPGTVNYVPNNYRSRYDDAAVMVNGIARLKTDTIITPYLGLGVGGEYISNNHVTVYAPTFPLEGGLGGDDCIVPAVQGLAGIDIAIINGWSVFTEYKYLVAIAPNLSNSGNVAGGYYTAKFEPGWIGQQLITAGIKYSF